MGDYYNNSIDKTALWRDGTACVLCHKSGLDRVSIASLRINILIAACFQRQQTDPPTVEPGNSRKTRSVPDEL